MPYIYQADIYCDSCGEAIKAELKKPDYPEPWDTDDYPYYTSDPGAADTPQHCGGGAECLEAMETESGPVGAFLDGGLTEDGAHYVLEALCEAVETGKRPSAVLRLWAELPEVADADQEGRSGKGYGEGDLIRWAGYVAGWDAGIQQGAAQGWDAGIAAAEAARARRSRR